MSTPKKSKPGPASSYTKAKGDALCTALASGLTLNEACRIEGMPPPSTVRTWAADPEHPISAQYARAREAGYQKMAEELIEISDDATNDWMTRRNSEGEEYEVVNQEHIQRSRLRVDTRKWLLSKALPKMYGDKVALTDAEGGPVQIVVQSGVPRASDG